MKVRSSSHLISGTPSNSSTWSLQNAHYWPDPQWIAGHLCGTGWLRGSCAAPKRGWELAEPRKIALLMIPSSRFVRRPPRGGDWSWECCSGGGSLGFKLAYEKGSFGPEALWIGTHFTVKSVVNKAEVSFPAKKNAEILVALKGIMDNARGMVRHADIRKLAGKESWLAGFCPS